MYIIIAGAGLVGGDLAKKLIESRHDVVVIERDKEKCDQLYAEIGAVTVNGNINNLSTLKEAGIEKAEAVVAATGKDSDNLALVVMARSFDVPYIIARMRNEQYERAYREAGVDKLLRVTDLLVDQMMVDINHPNAQRIATIGGGEADIYRAIIPERAKISGKTIEEIARTDDFPGGTLFLARIEANTQKFEISYGKQEVNPGDELFFISKNINVKKMIKILTRQYKEKRKR